MTDRTPPPGWVIPEGYEFSSIGRCRSCGAEIAWTTTETKRPAPLDQDGRSHFVTCPDADGWRKRK